MRSGLRNLLMESFLPIIYRHAATSTSAVLPLPRLVLVIPVQPHRVAPPDQPQIGGENETAHNCGITVPGCAIQQPINDSRPAQFKEFNDQINAQRDAKQISYADGQKKKWDFHRGLWPNDPYSAEFFTYTIMLGEKVDKGELAASEYMYLGAKKSTEIQERINADQSRRTRDAAAVMQSMPTYQPVQIQPYQIRTPTQTHCHTDSFGNTNCTTY